MRARPIRLANTGGARTPKPQSEEAALQQEIDAQVFRDPVLITSRRQPRLGWAKAARQMRERGDDRLLDQPTATRFDDEAWRWR